MKQGAYPAEPLRALGDRWEAGYLAPLLFSGPVSGLKATDLALDGGTNRRTAHRNPTGIIRRSQLESTPR